MRPSRVLFTLFAFVIVSLSMPAAAITPAEKLLVTLRAHQKGIPFRSSFKQKKMLGAMGLELASTGELTVKKRGHAIWKVFTPAALTVEITPAEIKITSVPGQAPRVLKKSDAGSVEMPGAAWLKLLMDEPSGAIAKFQITEPTPNRFRLVPTTAGGFEWVELYFLANADLREVSLKENKDDLLNIEFSAKGR